MEPLRRRAVYVILFLGWILICIWLFTEHRRVEQASRDALLNRATDIATSLSVVIRSSGRFGVVPRMVLEAILEELAKSDELISVALLDQEEEIVAAGGDPSKIDWETLQNSPVSFGSETLTVLKQIELGRTFERRKKADSTGSTDSNSFSQDAKDSPKEQHRPPREFDRTPSKDSRKEQHRPPREHGRTPMESPSFRRRLWRSGSTEEMIRKHGLHQFVLVMSTQMAEDEITRDFWLRLALGGIALVAALGLAVAWRGMEKSAALQLRLVRSEERAAHLEEKNIAAAGLAHETRNPLNIIRGIAQMLSKDSEAPSKVRPMTEELMEEVDRVTSRLNAFLEYSKPLNPELIPIDVADVLQDVVRTLEMDREDMDVSLILDVDRITIAADKELLRQLIFNLLLNALQSSPEGGKVKVDFSTCQTNGAVLEIRDTGPGVPEADQEDIFRPYFTTRQDGTGLGLAIVRQIVQAHGWDITYFDSDDWGAGLRITEIEILKESV